MATLGHKLAVQAASTWRAFEQSNRRPLLSHTHHVTVAPLDRVPKKNGAPGHHSLYPPDEAAAEGTDVGTFATVLEEVGDGWIGVGGDVLSIVETDALGSTR